jgi:hypothetical protein
MVPTAPREMADCAFFINVQLPRGVTMMNETFEEIGEDSWQPWKIKQIEVSKRKRLEASLYPSHPRILEGMKLHRKAS